MGRPKGKIVPEFSLKPVAGHLRSLLKKDVVLAEDCIGKSVETLADNLKNGEILLLENLRYHKEEQENNSECAQGLARLCDVYVNNAFAVSHRAHASVAAITEYAPASVAGFLLERELDYFDKAIADPERPLLAIVGGAKVSSKLGALENMINCVDSIIIGGAMANTFLKSKGIEMGNSMIEEDLLETASLILKKAEEKGVVIHLPVDMVVADDFNAAAKIQTVSVHEIPEGFMALDIGPESLESFKHVISTAQTIVWNGPMGVFEMEPFSNGTLGIVDSVAGSEALTIVGGGDTDVAVHMTDKADKISYISTGGGAFLHLMEGKDLPAVTCLNRAMK
jgi:phosphoglycerate kinase